MITTNEKRTTNTISSISSSSSSTTRVRAREVEINVSVESLREIYRAAIGQSMSEICERSLRRDLERGVPYIYFHYALEETAYAPRPSWRYVMAIVRRLQSQEADPEALMMAMGLRE